MMSFKYFLFDYDGTLCHTQNTISNAMAATFKKYQLDVPSEQIRLKMISSGMVISDAIITMHPEGKALPADLLEDMVKSYRTIYGDLDVQFTTLFEGAGELLSGLKSAEKKVAVLSNKGIQTVVNSLKYFKLDQYADLVIADGSVPGLKLKPDPITYSSIIKQKFQIRNEQEVLMTGDTYADLLFAKNCGIKSCWASYGYGNKDDCNSLAPDYRISKLSAFTDLFLR